ncbi:MAG: hypothetical protein LLG06_15345 [Desulfobacteraceae bacterium]|nr:hypothetical protein [Desulfobacteraceae bacterium]
MIYPLEVAEFIRENSKAGELVTAALIESAFEEHGLAAGNAEEEPPSISALIEEAFRSHGDLKEISDDSGIARYFSGLFMTEAYARVLLLKLQGPLEMIAEVIRENSRAYPRPVPLALFEWSPFDLSRERIEPILKEMAESPGYRDIALLTTSIGNLFAYSTDYLEPGHAEMLAEWIDVGQAENP